MRMPEQIVKTCYNKPMNTQILETNHWNMILSRDQRYFGRCVVLLKRPCGTMAEVTPDEMVDLLILIKKYETVFKKEYGAVMFNYSCLMNDAYKNTPPDPQVHWHFRPRYDKPVVFEGVEFLDEQFGHHYERKPERSVDADLEEKIVAELKEKFQ